MCTMSFHAADDGYDLFFNRDERRTRQPAGAAEIQTRGTVRCMAPIDTDGGGSWIAVNEFGITSCLLNGFTGKGQAEPQPSAITRGTLPLTMMDCGTTAEARARLDEIRVERFRPFVLVVLGFRTPGWCARWDGRELSVSESIESPLISSSFFTEEVRASRETVFETLREEIPQDAIKRHLSFHRSHRPRRGAHSPCMHREDAQTVSMTRVTVTADNCRLQYWGSAPCRATTAGPALELPRRESCAAIEGNQ
jgi:hypothetical protein